MDDQLITVRTYSLPWQADLARTMLEAEGIPAFVADANTVSMNWLYSNAIGGVRLQVPESYAEAANETLSSDKNYSPSVPEDESDSPTCPKCGNHNSTIIRRGRRWTFLTWLLVGVPLFFPPKRYQCLECGTIWKSKGKGV